MKFDGITQVGHGFSEVLLWKNCTDLSEVNLYVKKQINVAENDIVAFFDNPNYSSLQRSIHLLDYHNDDSAFWDILKLWQDLSNYDDQQLAESCWSYLCKFAKSEHAQRLFELWKELEAAKEYAATEMFYLVVKSKLWNKEVVDFAKNAIWGDDLLLKMFSTNIDLPEIYFEMEKRLRDIAPMIKYLKLERYRNFYYNEWIEIGEPWIEYKFGKKKEQKEERTFNEDEDFIIKILQQTDDLSIELIKTRLANFKSSDETEKLKSDVRERDRVLRENFLDNLPEKSQDWADSFLATPNQLEEFWEAAEQLAPTKFMNNSKLRRNDPCHCGSGKKFKKCCLS